MFPAPNNRVRAYPRLFRRQRRAVAAKGEALLFERVAADRAAGCRAVTYLHNHPFPFANGKPTDAMMVELGSRAQEKK